MHWKRATKWSTRSGQINVWPSTNTEKHTDGIPQYSTWICTNRYRNLRATPICLTMFTTLKGISIGAILRCLDTTSHHSLSTLRIDMFSFETWQCSGKLRLSLLFPLTPLRTLNKLSLVRTQLTQVLLYPILGRKSVTLVRARRDRKSSRSNTRSKTSAHYSLRWTPWVWTERMRGWLQQWQRQGQQTIYWMQILNVSSVRARSALVERRKTWASWSVAFKSFPEAPEFSACVMSQCTPASCRRAHGASRDSTVCNSAARNTTEPSSRGASSLRGASSPDHLYSASNKF